MNEFCSFLEGFDRLLEKEKFINCQKYNYNRDIMNKKYFLVVGLVIGIIALSPLSAADDEDIGVLDALDITPLMQIQM